MQCFMNNKVIFHLEGKKKFLNVYKNVFKNKDTIQFLVLAITAVTYNGRLSSPAVPPLKLPSLSVWEICACG